MADYFDRTNDAGSGSWYDRPNIVDNIADIVSLSPTAAGAGIVYAHVTAAGIITNNTSYWFGADFAPVNGDIAAYPTRWPNPSATGGYSTITVNPDGTFVIDPAFPNGTQFPRRLRDVSAGTWFQDTLTINNGAGTAAITAPLPVFNGVGTAMPAISGGAAPQAPAATFSGAGTMTPRATGAVAVTAPAATFAGNGAIINTTGVRRVLVSRLGVNIPFGTQMRAVVVDSLNPGFNVLFNGIVTVQSGGTIQIQSATFPAPGQYVILFAYAAGVDVDGDDDQGVAPRRVPIISVA